MLGTRIRHYQVLELLGRGGMGEIYTARDERLDRIVALKAISGDWIGDASSRLQLLTEARAAAALDHPFICAVHEVLEEDGRTLIVMEYVRGETLHARLARGPLPFSEACHIGSEIAEALAAAHARGIIHRDLKPSNIIITTSGHVKVLDFGLALLTAAEPETPTAHYSERDLRVAGTLDYIAPELFTGARPSAQSDLYSLGVILFQMVTGRLPRGESDPGVLNPGLSPQFSSLVQQLLAADRARRPSDASSVREALEQAGRREPARVSTRSLAVLPFKQILPDPESAHLGVGLADATITELALVRSVVVRPTASILRFEQTSDAIEAAQQLGVDAVVCGSFQRSGPRLRITVQLINATEGRTLWSTKIDTRLEDVFSMQDEVSRKIVQALQLELTPADEQRKGRVAPPAGPAYDLYLRGRICLLRQTLDDVHAAIAYFERAREIDPANPLLLAGMADAYARLAFTFEPEGAWLVRTREICDRLLQLDPDSPEGHYLRGRLLWCPDGGFDHVGAIRAFKTAIAGKPNLSEAHDWLGTVLFHVGLTDDAEVEIDRAMEIDPQSWTALADVGFVPFIRQDFDKVIEICRRIQESVPHGLANYLEALCYVHRGELDRARLQAEHAIENEITPVRFYPVLALIAALEGDSERSDAEVERAVRHRKEYGHYHHAQYDLACVAAVRGDKDNALLWLIASARNGFPCFPLFRADPFLASIHSDERFLALTDQLEQECREYDRIYRE